MKKLVVLAVTAMFAFSVSAQNAAPATKEAAPKMEKKETAPAVAVKPAPAAKMEAAPKKDGMKKSGGKKKAAAAPKAEEKK